MTRSFSGIQPSGNLHLGNYLGAIQSWIKLSHHKDYENIFCIADYHSITNMSQSIEKNSWEMIIDILACNINLKQSILFIQSHNSDHLELFWILNCFSFLGELKRMHQFKEKSHLFQQSGIQMSLLNYPILQAADILLYKTLLVPIGHDQMQHLELTREIIRRLNKNYQMKLPEPKAFLPKIDRLMGIDGKTKMSKSRNNSIDFNESKLSLTKKIMSALTDENRKKRTDPGNPMICNIFRLHSAFNKNQIVKSIEMDCKEANIGCIDCKKNLIEVLWNFIENIQESKQYWVKNPDEIKDILLEGQKKAKAISSQTLKEIKEKLNLIPEIQ